LDLYNQNKKKRKSQPSKICCCFLAFSFQKEVELGGEPLPDVQMRMLLPYLIASEFMIFAEDVVILPYLPGEQVNQPPRVNSDCQAKPVSNFT
jgi:hypothetical protein